MHQELNTEELDIRLKIVDHPSDKQFPMKAFLMLKYKGRLYDVGLDLDGEYRTGDTGLEPRHLAPLFHSMEEALRDERGVLLSELEEWSKKKIKELKWELRLLDPSWKQTSKHGQTMEMLEEIQEKVNAIAETLGGQVKVEEA